MKERPMIFNGESVRAILGMREILGGGHKTQTRRVVKPSAHQKKYCRERWGSEATNEMAGQAAHVNLHQGVWGPHGKPGDRLWVRETFCHKCDDNGFLVYTPDGGLDPSCFHYKADGYDVVHADSMEKSPWCSPIFMPRLASRITLEITGVRVERLQEITAADVVAEGAAPIRRLPDCRVAAEQDHRPIVVIPAFRALWDAINAKRGCPWESNPYVRVIEFERIQNASSHPNEKS